MLQCCSFILSQTQAQHLILWDSKWKKSVCFGDTFKGFLAQDWLHRPEHLKCLDRFQKKASSLSYLMLCCAWPLCRGNGYLQDLTLPANMFLWFDNSVFTISSLFHPHQIIIWSSHLVFVQTETAARRESWQALRQEATGGRRYQLLADKDATATHWVYDNSDQVTQLELPCWHVLITESNLILKYFAFYFHSSNLCLFWFNMFAKEI